MNPTANATRPTWQWPKETATASSTGNESKHPKEEDTMNSRPYTRPTWVKVEEAEDSPIHTTPGSFGHHEQEAEEEEEEARPAENANQVPREERHYRPRKCRICLEVVHPTFHPPAEGIAGMLNPAPVVEYISEDPESGRFIRPCNCKGSMRWIHEGCLREWRRTDLGSSNYWQCPTCHFRYRLQRMDWSRTISNKVTQIALTVLILFVTIFILGFIADPIINIYLDPYEVITGGGFNEPVLEDGGTWYEHLLKGLASLGVLGMVKAIIAMGPWNWLNLRPTLGGRRGGRAANGRDRIESISWWLIAIGVITFLWVHIIFLPFPKA